MPRAFVPILIPFIRAFLSFGIAVVLGISMTEQTAQYCLGIVVVSGVLAVSDVFETGFTNLIGHFTARALALVIFTGGAQLAAGETYIPWIQLIAVLVGIGHIAYGIWKVLKPGVRQSS